MRNQKKVGNDQSTSLRGRVEGKEMGEVGVQILCALVKTSGSLVSQRKSMGIFQGEGGMSHFSLGSILCARTVERDGEGTALGKGCLLGAIPGAELYQG